MTLKTDHLQMLDVDDMLATFRCSKSSLMRWVEEGRVPDPIYIGRSPLWHKDTLEAWLTVDHGLIIRKPSKPKRDVSELA